MSKPICTISFRRRTSSGRLEESVEEEHSQYQQLKGHNHKLNTQLDVHKPLVNLVDNLVTMGSLYSGDNLMLASQYKRVSNSSEVLLGACSHRPDAPKYQLNSLYVR